MPAREYIHVSGIYTGAVGADARGQPNEGMPEAVTHPEAAAAWLSVPVLLLAGWVARGEAPPWPLGSEPWPPRL